MKSRKNIAFLGSEMNILSVSNDFLQEKCQLTEVSFVFYKIITDKRRIKDLLVKETNFFKSIIYQKSYTEYQLCLIGKTDCNTKVCQSKNFRLFGGTNKNPGKKIKKNTIF